MDDKTLEFLGKIAEKVGTTVDHLWPVLVRQSVISGIFDLLIDGCFLFLIYFSYTKMCRFNFNDEAAKGLCWTGWAVICGVTVIIVGVSASDTVCKIINPEYFALKQILP